MASKRPRRVSQKQLEFLEYLIWKSKNADVFSKRCLIWLIRKSQGLTRAVRIGDENIVNAVSKGFHDMSSANCTTHVDAMFGLAGSDLCLVNGASIGNHQIELSTIKKLTPTRDEIEAVVPAYPYGVRPPGGYPGKK